jgi:hypothetical protein
MISLKHIFHRASSEQPSLFWRWFVQHESRYRLQQWSSRDFLDAAMVQLRYYDPWIKVMLGPEKDGCLELIVTADGDLAFFARVFELVKAAPTLEGWSIVALKQAIGMEKISIEINEWVFNSDTMQFYAEEDERFPDEVSLVLTHGGYSTQHDDLFQTGGMLYLESALGELDAVVTIDRYRVGPDRPDRTPLISLAKLPDYLLWREKEVSGKYEEPPPDLPHEKWRIVEAEDAGGMPMLAAFNKAYSDWPFRPCYPWLVVIEIHFRGRKDGLPDPHQWIDLQQIEDEMMVLLSAQQVLLLGHKTYNKARIIYTYARDYLAASVLLHDYRRRSNRPYEFAFYITRDKYWQAAAGFF